MLHYSCVVALYRHLTRSQLLYKHAFYAALYCRANNNQDSKIEYNLINLNHGRKNTVSL